MAEAARKKRPWTERFSMGLSGDLPDRAVPGPLKSAQMALAAPAESIRRGVGDFLTADSLPGDYLVPGGPMVGAMFRKQLGNLVNDPVRTGMEMTGYPAARRSMDAGRLALESEDPIEGAGRATRALGEGGLALAQVAGNAYGIGSNVTKLYRGKTPVAPLPDADMAAVQARAAKAQTAGPTQLQEMIDEAGARADAAYAKIKPVTYPKAQPTRAARRQRRQPQDAYTPYEISPEDQALLAQRAQYLKQNAAEDDQILRLALAAEDEAPDVATGGRLALESDGAASNGPKVYDPEDEAWLTGWDRLTPDELAEYEELAKSAAWHTPQQDARYYALGEKWDGRGARTKPALEGSFKVVDPSKKGGVTLSANGAGMDPLSKPRIRKDSSFKKRYREAVARGEVMAPDAAAPARAKVRQGELVDRDAVAKALNDIYEANDYALPRNYATQIAKQLGRNPQSIRRTLFNMREAGDPRVAEIGKYDGPQDWGVLNTGRKLALPLAMTGGQAYVADRYRRENGYQMGLQ